ncbi:MAG: rane protein [Solirubrobacterales bacterium]|nr:rane protein [Solirubrobacterales bacterium]
MQQIDWEAAERSPEFQELVRERRRFVIPATVFYLSWYLGFILLAGYARDFMGSSVYQGLTVGYVLALTQFVMVAVLGIAYLRRAERIFDPLAARVAERALAGHGTVADADTVTTQSPAPPGDPRTGGGRLEGTR